jgi:phosphomannomutase / phosphoglucomutase
MSYSENIFRSNDIRGVYGNDFDEDFAEKLGMSFATFLKRNGDEKNTVIVGRDIRNGSETLKNSLIKGLTISGFNIIDIDKVTTPVYYFSVKRREKSGGIMITGSHLPKEFNGFKIVDKNGSMINQDNGLMEIKETIRKEDFISNSNVGEVEKYEKVFDDYSNFILRKINIGNKLKLVIDPCNSVPGLIVPRLFREIGCEVIVINENLDGSFPSRSPEPRPENLQQLQNSVKSNKADFGIAYDSDGDRVVFVDNEGNVIDSSSLIIMMLAEHYLGKKKGSAIVFDLGCSMALTDMIKNMGGVPIETRVGTSFIKNDMSKHNAILGGESSNHLYFGDVFNFDDAAFASLKMGEIISELKNNGMNFSDKIKSLPKYPYFPEWEFECPDEKKYEALEKIKNKFKNSGLKISEIDGLKIYFDDGWVLWRVSGTRPSAKIYLEAKTEDRLEELKNFAKEELMKAMSD